MNIFKDIYNKGKSVLGKVDSTLRRVRPANKIMNAIKSVPFADKALDYIPYADKAKLALQVADMAGYKKKKRRAPKKKMMAGQKKRT